MSLNRVVALITPACALAAGWAASWLAEHVPGIGVTKENLQAVFIAGAVAVLAPALHWLHGWQKWEARNDAELAIAARGFPDPAPTVVVDEGAAVDEAALDISDDELDDEFDDSVDFDEFEDTSVTDEEEPVPAGT
jgi:hypothetical protein